MTKLTGAMEDYLEAIYIIEKSKGICRITDIAEQMLITKASANKAVKALKHLKFLAHEKYSTITLTELGKKTAENVYEKHVVLLNFLTNVLKVPFEVAETEACKIEHVISEDTLDKIVAYSESQI